MVTLLIGTIGIGIIVALIMQSYNALRDSKQFADLQADLDLAAFTIKGILEESRTVSISGGDHLTATHVNGAQREFYPSGSNLVLEETDTGATRNVITTLSALSFQQTGNLVLTSITVTNGGRQIQTSFNVVMRN